MGRRLIRIFVFAVFLAFLSSICITGIVTAAQVETLIGTVVKQGKGFVIETDDGDYIVKGKDVLEIGRQAGRGNRNHNREQQRGHNRSKIG